MSDVAKRLLDDAERGVTEAYGGHLSRDERIERDGMLKLISDMRKRLAEIRAIRWDLGVEE